MLFEDLSPLRLDFCLCFWSPNLVFFCKKYKRKWKMEKWFLIFKHLIFCCVNIWKCILDDFFRNKRTNIYSPFYCKRQKKDLSHLGPKIMNKTWIPIDLYLLFVCCVFVNGRCEEEQEEKLWERMVAYVSMGRRKQ